MVLEVGRDALILLFRGLRALASILRGVVVRYPRHSLAAAASAVILGAIQYTQSGDAKNPPVNQISTKKSGGSETGTGPAGKGTVKTVAVGQAPAGPDKTSAEAARKQSPKLETAADPVGTKAADTAAATAPVPAPAPAPGAPALEAARLPRRTWRLPMCPCLLRGFVKRPDRPARRRAGLRGQIGAGGYQGARACGRRFGCSAAGAGFVTGKGRSDFARLGCGFAAAGSLSKRQ